MVDPWSVLDKQGADAVRWYFYTNSAPWIPSRFGAEAVSEVQRKFQGTLWNTYAFFALYAEIDGYDPSKYDLKKCRLSLMDKWVLSKLNTIVKKVDAMLAEYNITDSARAIQDFVDELSNWYVRRGRERYWGSEMTDDKAAAYTTLYTVLVTLAKVIAPYTPFMAEMMYRNLVPQFFADAPESVHLCDFPKADESLIDPALEKGMEDVLDVVVLGRAARNAGNLKNRQPLSEMIVAVDDHLTLDLSEELVGIILDELNIKKMTLTRDPRALITYKLKPQMRTLGPKYGKLLGGIRTYLEQCDAVEVMAHIMSEGVFRTQIDGAEVVLCEDDLLISTESAQGYVTAGDKGITVALDTRLTEELLDEGCERELVSKVQTMRKEADFEVTDRIRIFFSAEGRAKRMLERGNFAADVLAESVQEGSAEGFTRALEVNGDKVTLTLVRV